jgi:hypothetical protein
MTRVLTIIGLLFFILEIIIFPTNLRTRKAYNTSQRWRQVYRWAWIIGLLLAVSSVFMRYPAKGNHGQQYILIGIPFVAAAFDEKGADYVSSLTPVFMAANALFWLLLPQLFMWGWQLIRKQESGLPARPDRQL